MSTQPISPLVAQVIEAQLSYTHAVTESVIDSLQHQIAEAEARNAAINDRITQLCTGDWMPNTRTIIAALYPSGDVIDRYRKQVES